MIKKVSTLVFFVFSLLTYMSPSYAESPSTFTDTSSTTSSLSISAVLCNVYVACTGPAGKLVAVLGIVSIGVGCFLGKLDFRTVAMFAVGVALIFGAIAIINVFSGGSMTCRSSGSAVTI